MIRLREIAMPPKHTEAQLIYESARILKISASKIKNLRIVRRSVDARKKPDVKIVYTVDVKIDGNEGKILQYGTLLPVLHQSIQKQNFFL